MDGRLRFNDTVCDNATARSPTLPHTFSSPPDTRTPLYTCLSRTGLVVRVPQHTFPCRLLNLRATHAVPPVRTGRLRTHRLRTPLPSFWIRVSGFDSAPRHTGTRSFVPRPPPMQTFITPGRWPPLFASDAGHLYLSATGDAALLGLDLLCGTAFHDTPRLDMDTSHFHCTHAFMYAPTPGLQFTARSRPRMLRLMDTTRTPFLPGRLRAYYPTHTVLALRTRRPDWTLGRLRTTEYLAHTPCCTRTPLPPRTLFWTRVCPLFTDFGHSRTTRRTLVAVCGPHASLHRGRHSRDPLPRLRALQHAHRCDHGYHMPVHG